MDPNLTLAHITHNTSMILLHHPIAYPPKSWNNYVALPRECSAQTCELAAVESSNIVDKFLTHRAVFVNAQFAFCAFVAAKALLFMSQVTKNPVRLEFKTLTRSLWEMSARWKRTVDGDGHTLDQAAIYARHLEHLEERCRQDPHFRFNLYDHTCSDSDCQRKDGIFPINPTYPATPARQSANRGPYKYSGPRPLSSNNASTSPSLANIMYGASKPSIDYQRQHDAAQPSPNGVTSAFQIPRPPPGLMTEGQQVYAVNGSPASSHLNVNGQRTIQDQSLLNLSDTFMDSQYLGLDRVITFEDANFFLPGDAFRWQ
jgi:hypothetical protein